MAGSRYVGCGCVPITDNGVLSMRDMQDRVYQRRRQYARLDPKNIPTGYEIEAELQREDEAAVVRTYDDGRRSGTTGY